MGDRVILKSPDVPIARWIYVMPFACIFVPNFPVAAVSRAEPELRELALAIFERQASAWRKFSL